MLLHIVAAQHIHYNSASLLRQRGFPCEKQLGGALLLRISNIRGGAGPCVLAEVQPRYSMNPIVNRSPDLRLGIALTRRKF